MGPAATWVCVAGGSVVIALTAADVFFTVLFPASGRGPVRKPLSALTWRAFRYLARHIGGERRRDLLSYSGPLLILVTITSWVLLLTVGWALVFWPLLGTQIVAASGTTGSSMGDALYYSGYTLTTLGLGDVTPTSSLARFLTVSESAVGFATVSMVITYFLSVYNALTRRRTRAALLHHVTGGTGRAADLVANFAGAGELPALRSQLRDAGAFVQEVCETHRSYPVLRYFHFRRSEYSLPRVLLLALDSAALLRALARAQDWPSLRLVDGAARQLLDELVPDASGETWSDRDRRRAARAFDAARATLDRAGDLVTVHSEQALSCYLAERAQWEPQLRDLAAAMLYRWDEVEPEQFDDARPATRSAAGHTQQKG